jgi:hypothetical protein
MAKEKINIQIGDEIIELKGNELEAFLEERAKIQTEVETRQTELNAQKTLKVSAYTKLGLTEEEINAIL